MKDYEHWLWEWENAYKDHPIMKQKMEYETAKKAEKVKLVKDLMDNAIKQHEEIYYTTQENKLQNPYGETWTQTQPAGPAEQPIYPKHNMKISDIPYASTGAILNNSKLEELLTETNSLLQTIIDILMEREDKP
jgi:hypothetical protein